MRVHRIIIESYPTPDGKPFDQQHPNDHETAVEVFHNPGAPFAVPKWLENIDLTDRLYTSEGDWREVPLSGGTIFDVKHEPLLTVPVLRRVNFFSKSAAQARLAYLTAWGAVGRVESSEPIEWMAGAA
ncbi:hypothetical protein PP634_gp45 [Arthrobacter phage Richie]|uniref:Uncharacterized protein n=1 Tax=Arthrobacter phage Richie TaxID=2419967 RepID=A0A3G2KIR7_9CAUD|nr:hypothetical protein PP634_gp45 [Arthrobacter phage Richie]AYN58871.1 hypothetical protein PBI_RICHIE_45 [Arthrobacter phage Richie]